MSKLAAALSHAALGFKVFPIKPGAKFPPLLNDWPHKATSDPALIDILWAPMPDANIGIHCAGFLVVDVDVAKGGNESLDTLADIYDLPPTLTSITPSGGKHLFYRLPDGHPGVPNSVSKLGPGLDVRSNGGYVVAPGSDTDKGRYHFSVEHPVVDAPDWLLRLCGQSTVKETKATAPVPDAPESAVERAASWLVTHPGAVEGQGGDAHTYATACRLRDFGVSEAQCVDLLASWNHVCSPPWALTDLQSKAHNAYRYAQEATAGKLAVVPSDFPIVAVGATTAKVRAPTKALRLDELVASSNKGAGYLVKGVLDRKSYAMEYGSPGAGKTFVALDIAYHVAAGKPWMERKVHQGVVLYLAFEGRGGIIKRAKALRQHYGTTEVPLYIAGASFNLRDDAGRHELGRIMAELPAKPVLIVIDTFAHALMGGDENSAQDVGAFNNAVQALIDNTGACVMILHHPTKGGNIARGSGALLGAIDTELEVEGGQVRSTKQRESELAPPIGFALHPMVVDVDDDGEDVTSCVVLPAAASAGDSLPVVNGNPKRGFKVLCALAPDNTPVDIDKWREACTEFLGTKEVRKRFFDMKNALQSKGYIVVKDGFVTRRLE